MRRTIPTRRIITAPTGEAFEIKVTNDGYIRVLRTYEIGEEYLELVSENGIPWLLKINNLGQLTLEKGVIQ